MSPSSLRRLLIVSTLAVVAIAPLCTALAASQGRSVAAHGNLSACSVVTKSAAEAALGDTVTSGLAAKSAYYDSCTYTGSRTLTALTILVTDTAMIRASLGGQTAASIYKQARSSLGKVKHVRGVGTKAFWSRKFQQLWVLKGDVLLEISGVRLPANPLALFKRLARTAMRRV